jgi:hypothetical protein
LHSPPVVAFKFRAAADVDRRLIIAAAFRLAAPPLLIQPHNPNEETKSWSKVRCATHFLTN